MSIKACDGEQGQKPSRTCTERKEKYGKDKGGKGKKKKETKEG